MILGNAEKLERDSRLALLGHEELRFACKTFNHLDGHVFVEHPCRQSGNRERAPNQGTTKVVLKRKARSISQVSGKRFNQHGEDGEERKAGPARGARKEKVNSQESDTDGFVGTLAHRVDCGNSTLAFH